jgi:hypothetical protein
MGDRYRSKNPGYTRQYNYGVSPEQFAEMLDEQGRACAICGSTDWPGGAKTNAPHVDHDHETGAVRGLLCGSCNKGLGFFQDDPERLLAASRYLERHRS